MMLYPAMKDLLKHIPSRYELVNVVACRARHIAHEAELSGEPLDEKPVSIAIQEVADGKLEAHPAQEDAQVVQEEEGAAPEEERE